MTVVLCPSCGGNAPANAKFCPECGVALKVAAARGGKSTGMRDTLIVVAALGVVAVGYFAIKKPAPKPEDFSQGQMSDAQHPPVTDESGQSMEMPALANLPTDYAGLVDAGNHNMDAGDFALAAECYRRALAIDGSSTNVRTDYGACLHGMGLPQRAIDEFRKVLVQEPSHTICNFNLGVVFNELKETDSARFYWTKYLQMDPKGPAAEAARKLLEELGK